MSNELRPQDLRIGNYHEYLVIDRVDERQEYWEVSQIDWQDIKYLSEPKPLHKAVEHYRAIPLTEEWLLKWGFQVNDDLDYQLQLDLNKYMLITESKGIFYPRIEELPEFSSGTLQVVSLNLISYVHQLQNLFFALTGEELKQNF